MRSTRPQASRRGPKNRPTHAPAATEVVRIALADDHAMYRAELRARLDAQPDFSVIGEASSPDETMALCGSGLPHVLLLDIAMRGGEGMTLLERLRDIGSDMRVLMMTTAIARPDLVRALQLGARGVIAKDAPEALLFKSIRRVRAGEYWVGRDMVADLVHALASAARSPLRPMVPSGRAFALTTRELEIVAAVASGYTNRQMAEKFAIAEDTIKHHLTSIFDKTGVSNRLELALFAIHHKLT